MNRAFVLAGGLMVLAGALASVYRYALTPAEKSAPAAISSSSQEASGFTLLEQPRSLPPVRFANGEGRGITLADFHGRVVLLNIWATWCVPCREEMPTLDRLQAELGGAEFEVVALSIDRSGVAGVTKFYGEIGIRHLNIYVDGSGQVSRDLNIIGLPTTLLVDKEGRELRRKIGPLEWDNSNVIAIIKRAVAPPAAGQSALPPPASRQLAALADAMPSGSIRADANQLDDIGESALQ